MPEYGPPLYGPELYGTGGDLDSAFLYEMGKKRDTNPFIKIEHIDMNGTVTDITDYYDSGGNISREKERAPDEIQAGDFDITLFNHNDYFSEYKAGSLFYGIQYHFSTIRVSVGFVLETGESAIKQMCLGYIDELTVHGDESKVTLRCRDLIHRVIDESLHLRCEEEIPTPGVGNVGDGVCSAINTKPFSTVNETWTLTCTTPGADGVAQFSVVGSVSGSAGTATSGTEFSSSGKGIKFTVSAGTTPWAASDVFTFQSFKHPEWTQENPAKIIWSVLTGYNYDTDTQEVWADSVLNLDHTQDTNNVDIDYESFILAVDQIDEFILTGYVDFSEPAQDVLESLLLLFLGSIFTNADGKIILKTWAPSIDGTARSFSDDMKITQLGYTRTVNEIINYVRVAYKKTQTWQFTGDEIIYDGWHVEKDAASILKYDKLSQEYMTRWYMSGGTHVEDFTTRLLSRYSEPPLVIEFVTGSDGILSEIGDKVYITDTKYGIASAAAEISKISKTIDSNPLSVEITARRDVSMDTIYGYLGSRADEGDGRAPQASTWGTATVDDKLFCYLGRSYKMY
jgi:hypothetical protein